MTFDSIHGAVRCAVAVQQHVSDYDGDSPPDRIVRLRIGINVGDAIADGMDVHGDSVNVAVQTTGAMPTRRDLRLARCVTTSATGSVCKSRNSA